MLKHFVLGHFVWDGYYGQSVQPTQIFSAASLEEAQVYAKSVGLDVWDEPLPIVATTTAPVSPDKG